MLNNISEHCFLIKNKNNISKYRVFFKLEKDMTVYEKPLLKANKHYFDH